MKMKMLKKMILPISRFVLPILIAFIICTGFLYLTKANTSKVNDNDFVFGFLGILLGFTLTILPFIVMLVDKVKEKAEVKYQNDPVKKGLVENKIKALYKEVKDDIIFVFISLIIVAFVYIIQDTPTPYINVGAFNEYFEKSLVIKSLRLSLFLLNLYAIYDLIAMSFKLSDTTGLLDSL